MRRTNPPLSETGNQSLKGKFEDLKLKGLTPGKWGELHKADSSAATSFPFASVVLGADGGGTRRGGAKDPGRETCDGHEEFAVACHDSLALAARDGGENLADRFGRGHEQAR